MILPSLRLQWINDSKGYGLFATEFIPAGTITFVQDDLDIVIRPDQLEQVPESLKQFVDRYSYLDGQGNAIISWDMGKYMNHCCQANTLSTGFGFEIAVKDIHPGEEVTDDYRLFTADHQVNISCGKIDCEGRINYRIPSSQFDKWDDQIAESLNLLREVEQPLMKFCTEAVRQQLDNYYEGDQELLSSKKIVGLA